MAQPAHPAREGRRVHTPDAAPRPVRTSARCRACRRPGPGRAAALGSGAAAGCRGVTDPGAQTSAAVVASGADAPPYGCAAGCRATGSSAVTTGGHTVPACGTSPANAAEPRPLHLHHFGTHSRVAVALKSPQGPAVPSPEDLASPSHSSGPASSSQGISRHQK